MAKIDSFEQACELLKLDPQTAVPQSLLDLRNGKAVVAAAMLFIVVQAANGDWKPDWNNYDEPKYFPWFDLEKDEESNPGGFSLGTVYSYYTLSYVGSRLCFQNREDARHAAETFSGLYRDLMVLE